MNRYEVSEFFNLSRVLYYLELTFKRRIILAELKEFTRFIFDRLSVNVNSLGILCVVITYLSTEGSIFKNVRKWGLSYGEFKALHGQTHSTFHSTLFNIVAYNILSLYGHPTSMMLNAFEGCLMTLKEI